MNFVMVDTSGKAEWFGCGGSTIVCTAEYLDSKYLSVLKIIQGTDLKALGKSCG
jgi:hypothetical protein